MTRYTKKILGEGTKFARDSIKGIFTFLGDLVKKNLWILIIIFAANYAFDHKFNLDFMKKVTTGSDRLKTEEGEVASAVIYMDDRIVIIQREGEKPKQYVGVRKAKLTKFDDGEIKMKVKNKGFGVEPGLTATAGDGLRLGLDVKWAYWKRWGLLGGITYPIHGRRLDRVRGHLGLGYDLPSRWFSSTSVWGGVDTNKDPRMGFRTRFGGGI